METTTKGMIYEITGIIALLSLAFMPGIDTRTQIIFAAAVPTMAVFVCDCSKTKEN